MKRYIALIEKENNSCYGVVFPDVAGCVSAGDTLDDALKNAEKALSLHLDGEKAPKARTLDEIKQTWEDWKDWKDAIIAAVPLIPLQSKSIRIQITIDNKVLSRIDSISNNRSNFLEEAARRSLSGL